MNTSEFFTQRRKTYLVLGVIFSLTIYALLPIPSEAKHPAITIMVWGFLVNAYEINRQKSHIRAEQAAIGATVCESMESMKIVDVEEYLKMVRFFHQYTKFDKNGDIVSIDAPKIFNAVGIFDDFCQKVPDWNYKIQKNQKDKLLGKQKQSEEND